MGKKLDKTDKIRYAELIDTYIRYSTEYTVSDNGSVTAKENGKWIKWVLGLGEVRDFHDIALNLIQKLMEQKGDIAYVQALCSDAMSCMMTNNDRSSAIKSLYIAHLTEGNPEEMICQPTKQQQKPNRAQKIEVEVREERKQPHAIRIMQSLPTNQQIADILNNSNCIVLHE